MQKGKYISRIDMSIEEFVSSYSGFIGYVYPREKESYFINSGAECDLFETKLKNGYLYCEDTMDKLAQNGFPHIAKEYDHDAYEAAVERFNASAGMDDRPCVPMPEHFRLDKEPIPDVEWDFDLEEEL